MDRRATFEGSIAAIALIGIYLAIVTLISGWPYAQSQFAEFAPYLLALAAGFGIQFGIYRYLITCKHHVSAGVVAATGTTSTGAMISCCAHYLVVLLPALGAAGLTSFVSRYQIEFFWFGLAANAFGIIYLARKAGLLARSDHNMRYAIVIGAALTLGLFFYARGQSAKLDASPAVSQPIVYTTLTNDEGGVEVSVTPNSLDSINSEWTFAVSINNHVIAIENDMTKSAEIFDDAGKSYAPKSWTGDAPGGHHVNGTLTFAAISPRPSKLILKMFKVGNVPERVFSWDVK